MHFFPASTSPCARFFSARKCGDPTPISSVPTDPWLQISVKLVKGGTFSPWLCTELNEGEELSCSEPDGKFVQEFDPSKSRAHYFIAAGSGITPVMSLLKTGLETEPASQYYLLYGNRKEENIMFKEELDQLSKRYENQCVVYHSLSSLKPSFAKRLFKSKKEDTGSFLKGRIDQKKIMDLIAHHTASGREPTFTSVDLENSFRNLKNFWNPWNYLSPAFIKSILRP